MTHIAPNHKVTVEFDAELELPDGVVLRANIHRPVGDGSWPVLLTRIPYGKDNPYEMGFHASVLDPVKTARRGYIVVVQDVRGTGASDGQLIPFRNEYEDGAATARWAAALPGSTGEVGTYGVSYFGFTQLAAAYGPTEEIRAMIPRMRCADPLDRGIFFRQGSLELGSMIFWYLGMSIPEVMRGADPRMGEILERLTADIDALPTTGYSYRPLDKFEPLTRPGVHGPLSESALELLRDPINPQAVEFLDITSRLDRITAPAFHIGSWYDMFAQQTLDDYVAMRARGIPTQLLMGPGAHGGTTLNPVGERIFGSGATDLSLDLTDNMLDMQLRWFDRWLKNDASKSETNPVRLFVMGENRWENFESWPIPSTPTRWNLHADGRLSQAAPHPSEGTQYRYDPDNPVSTAGGSSMMDSGHHAGAYDQRLVETRADVLVFTSEPLEKDVTVIGKVTASIWATSDAVDTDFVVRVCDVTPDGTSWNIVDGIVRAQYRDGYDNPTLIEPGTPYLYNIDLWSTANTFRKGHRIRVHVTSSNFPRWDANPNTGTPFSSSTGIVATQTIHHDPEHPSSFTLPIVDR